MKKITTFTIVWWSILFVAGIAFAATAIIVPLLGIFFWIGALFSWIGLVFWIIMFLLAARKSQSRRGGAFVGNKTVLQRIARETDEAVSRYKNSVNRTGFLQKTAIYERPWFLLCGTARSGKSSLLKGSGLNFPLRYPSERDGVQVDGSNQVMWYFANESVWIDTPGTFLEENGREDFQALLQSLERVRPGTPVDGVALVVNTYEILNADDLKIKEIARQLRSRIDDMIVHWGIEFPVYLIFNHTDEIPGFNEYFSEELAGADQIFGATISATKTENAMPRLVFAEEFNLLIKSLTDFRLDRLHKEPDQSRKRQICRFVIHFQAIQPKLGVLVAELFKPSNYGGRPLFRGFYFTSCQVQSSQQEHVAVENESNVSMTIVNHPLNPHRALGGSSPRQTGSGTVPAREKNILRSIFVLPLFRDIMVWDKPLVKATQKRSRQQLIRHYALLGLIGIVALCCIGYLAISTSNISRFYNEVSVVLESLPPEQAPLLDQYSALGNMRQTMQKLQAFDDYTPLSMGIGLYRGRELLLALKKGYFYRLRRCLIAPAVKYLEYDIQEKSSSYEELTGDDYDRLYRSLKAYLTISEAASSHPGDIDTVFLRPYLIDAIRQTILASINSSRLPEKIETTINENMGLLLIYLRRGELPGMQANQNLVADARSRLRRLPGARAVYEGVIGSLVPNAPQVTLGELLSQSGAGLLSSKRTISTLYSQQGWDNAVKPALKDASLNPYKVDWVIGLSKQDVPDSLLDKGKLYDEMIVAYCDDYRKQWCDFMSSVETAPFVDLAQASRLLQKMVGDGSELQKLLDAIGKVTLIKDESGLDKAGAKIMGAASKMKSTAASVKNIQKTAKKYDLSFGGGSPFDKLNGDFDVVRAFAASSGGSLSGYAGYKENILVLVDKLTTIGLGNDNRILAVLSGKDDDPLYNGWKYTRNALGVMPEDIALGMSAVLLKPLEMTGVVASQALTSVVNTAWQVEVVKPFTNRFSGRYPFSSTRSDDASYSDVMDFFRPVTGSFWGFYDRVLSSYIVKNGSEWMVRSIGGVRLNFNPELSASLSSADLLRSVFFKPDGTIRSLDITITPALSNKNIGKLEVHGQIIDLLPGGKSGRITWPLEGQGNGLGATLKIQAGNNFWQDISFPGAWGFLKLMNAAKISKLNSSTFSAKWQVNVQNMYMVYFEARVQVATAENPFGEPLFQNFSCPTIIIIGQTENTGSAISNQ